ncbi:hypothetical protein Tco_0821791 [Tanacetum coccineum]|uniref:GAG-pre-integrase domain-containing protein n=1 Tax=Tanacetum coccineum TaxID=301880 RepID=A0ABQ5AG80_9ASTR
MHNNIMAAGSKDRPPMLGPGRYSQWRSPVEAAENIPPVAAHEEAETIHNMTTENKLYFQAEKEAIFLILTGIGDEIYSTVDACNTAKEMWTAIERLQQESTFAKQRNFKIAQSEKPRLYEIPYDTSDPANRFCSNGVETVTLEKESRSKLDKDKKQLQQLQSVSWLKLHQLKHGYGIEDSLNLILTRYIPKLSKKDIVTGLPKLKYVKDQLCSSCEMGKAKRSSFKTKAVPSSKGRLNLLHMDLCGPMRVASINGKKYILISKKPVPECSDLAPQRQEMSVENVSSGLVPQGQKASDYDNSDPVPPRQNVVPTAEKTDSLQQGLEFLFSPLLEEYYNPAHGHDEDNNNDQAPNASFQEAEFINPFCTRVQEIGESSSRNIDNTDVHSFQPQSHDYRWTRDHPLEQVRGNPTMPVQTRR